MAANLINEVEDLNSLLVLPEQGCADSQLDSQVTIPPNTFKGEVCQDSTVKSEAYSNKQMENKDSSYSSCLVKDIEIGNAETLKNNDKAMEKLKADTPLTKVLQRQISFQISEKVMQLLMDDSLVLPKFASKDKCVTERTHDNRARKYKRSTSFNSRRVVLLFSLLSSLGTLVLIYLTLRVRYMSNSG
ncbi:uncharacterized protein LOC124932055 isoform X1 [Impatiens glandulifera]|uniref:uncharacterized protein LOC124932055 isoform X1 n=1 Tax=Impatiens glandulifera TaxID=253017 RepID=UPI001FB114C4|nr:uncharacterized protein LOC124932055 isoform X1 [Impatiens glandulifera]